MGCSTGDSGNVQDDLREIKRCGMFSDISPASLSFGIGERLAGTGDFDASPALETCSVGDFLGLVCGQSAAGSGDLLTAAFASAHRHFRMATGTGWRFGLRVVPVP